ncbi:hypothetical protein DVJ78_00615 [Humibacter sp. BT305]|nr:hypothetical protein DVJ78_00615 [Humibacter sp. BT305]
MPGRRRSTTSTPHEADAGVSRRVLLGLAATGGVGSLLWSTGVGGAATAASATTAPVVPAAPGATGPVTSGLTPFPQQDDLNFQTQFNYGEAAYGAAEVGEVAAAVEEVQAALAQIGTANLPVYQPYNDTFEALAARMAADADAEKAAGRLASARSKYLRAAGYYTSVLFFVLGGSAPTREAEVYRAMQRCWAEAAALLDPVWTRVEIPMTVRFPSASGTPVARNVIVPAYWARASGDGPKPTVIINNGSDAQLVDTFAFGGAAALERGYNALMFEGPGQGSLLFEQDIPFTPHWEDVITPLVDFVLAQPETDAASVALTGWSFGGLLVMRAAAHEHRLAAVVADPVFYDPLTPYARLQGIPNDVWVNDVYPSFPQHGPQGRDALRFLLGKRGEIFGEAFHQQALSGVVIQDLVGLLDAIGAYTGTPRCSARSPPIRCSSPTRETTSSPVRTSTSGRGSPRSPRSASTTSPRRRAPSSTARRWPRRCGTRWSTTGWTGSSGACPRLPPLPHRSCRPPRLHPVGRPRRRSPRPASPRDRQP